MAGVSVFFSYAQEDQTLVEEFKKHLMVFKRQKLINEWYDHSFLPGSTWTHEHEQHLESASLIALLISPDFINSDYCYGTEMRRAMQRNADGTARVLPILLKPVLWEGAPFAILSPLPSNTKFVTTWLNQDEAFLNISQGFLQILKELQSPNKAIAQQPPQLYLSSQPIFMLPFRRDPFFTGREAILTQLYTLLHENETVALTQPPALSGLGGIGKTQTAIEYAYRYREHYQHIFWVRSANSSEIVSDLLKISELLNLPEKQATDQELIIAAVKRWLEQNPGWLLIFDNADELAMVTPYLPIQYVGHLLFTTRSQHPGALARPIDLEQMTLEEGALLLLRRARLLEPTAPLLEATPEYLKLARQLVEELGGLPLALNQAGAYIEETKCGLTKYLSLYHTQRQKLLQHRGQQASFYGHSAPVATTWDLSFKTIEEKNPAAAKLLCLCAFLAPNPIPEELFSKGSAATNSTLEFVAADPFAFEEALSDLLAYSLLRRDPESQTLLMHRLIQVVLKDGMSQQTQQFWIERSIKIVNATLPKMAFENWEEYERLLPHVQNCLLLLEENGSLLEENELLLKEAGRLLNECGLYLKDRYGFFQIAERMYQRAYKIYEHLLGARHPSTLITQNNLALVYSVQGRYEEAERMYRQMCEVSEQVLGAEHPSTLIIQNNLALVYSAQERYEEAKRMYQQVYEASKQVLGAEHPSTLTTLGNLAGAYKAQGLYIEAEELYTLVCEVQKRVLGVRHPYLATSLSNLAEVYSAQHKYGEAENCYLHVVAIKELIYGSKHPEIITDLSALARLYQAQGDDELTYGSKHSEIINDLSTLVRLYQAQSKHEQANTLLRRIESIQRQS